MTPPLLLKGVGVVCCGGCFAGSGPLLAPPPTPPTPKPPATPLIDGGPEEMDVSDEVLDGRGGGCGRAPPLKLMLCVSLVSFSFSLIFFRWCCVGVYLYTRPLSFSCNQRMRMCETRRR